MDRLIYVSMSGAKATLQRQEVLSHNLANVATNGFRAEMAALRAVPVRGDGASTRVYTLETTIGYDQAPGSMQTTGRSLDVGMRGQAWLAVQALERHRGLHTRRHAGNQCRRHLGGPSQPAGVE